MLEKRRELAKFGFRYLLEQIPTHSVHMHRGEALHCFLALGGEVGKRSSAVGLTLDPFDETALNLLGDAVRESTIGEHGDVGQL